MKTLKQVILTASLALSCLPGCASPGRIYTFTAGADGFHTKTHFYDTGREVVAFDAQFTPAAAEAAVRFLRGQTKSPLRYLVITHPNPDKFNGAGVFRAAGAKVIASEATARAMPGVHAYKQNFFENVAGMFPRGTYPAPATVDETFTGTAELSLAGGTVILKELSRPGVSSTQTVALLPELRALVVGDLVHGRAHAWLEGGIVNGAPRPDLAGWLADLAELAHLPGVTEGYSVYGGRGQVLPLMPAIAAQSEYLREAERIVTEYVRKLPDARAELNGPNAAKRYAEIENLLRERFPEYELSYLVQYGVYGLALEKF